ncbi:unnamed protein product [Microthlaspi erraticum]|uniref:Uncharacterized protein n=1 Tax=Microthlaspi erraticum TaxID=1685480 RepID=A0A6D2KG24_9BRAS|nr:unnamed protein product [Microthlaspi erraticum]
MAFPCHLLNFWRSPILLWQPQQRGSSLEPHTPQSNSTQAHPNPHSPGPDLQLDPQLDPQLETQLDRAQAPLLANPSCPTNVYTGGLKSMFSPLTTVVSSGLGQEKLGGSNQWMCELELELPSNSLCSMRRLVLQNLMSIQPGSVALLSVGFTPAAHKIGVMSPPTLRRLPR